MNNLIKNTYYVFLLITLLTALITLFGLWSMWSEGKTLDDFPLLEWLVTTFIVEVLAIIFAVARKGLKYLPDVQTDKKTSDTLIFMEQFLSAGTSATIVSNRLSWLTNQSDLLSTLQRKIESGINIEVITPAEVSVDLKDSLSGANFFVTGDNFAPEARFTLINNDRAGAEKLAIARGVHPDHEITIFDNNSGPQIIALAKDIIRKSKIQTNESS